MACDSERDTVMMLQFPDQSARKTAKSRSFRRYFTCCTHLRWYLSRAMSTVDARFPCIEDELQFIQARLNTNIVSSLLLAVLLFLAGIVAHVGPLYQQEVSNADSPFEWTSSDLRTWYFVTCMFAGLVCVAISAAAGTRISRLAFFLWDWESIALGCLIFCTSFVSYAMALETATSWSNNSARASILNAALIIDAIITASCLYIPIRTCRLWILMVSTTVSFIAGILVVSARDIHVSTQQLFLPPFALACLCFFSFVGAVRHERHVRQEWLSTRQVFKSLDDLQAKDIELKGACALTLGMHKVAEAMCDVVIKLAEDLVVYDAGLGRQAFFGAQVEGKPFTCLLAENDVERFCRLLVQVQQSRLPQCLPVTLLREGLGYVEAQLLVVDTGLARPKYCVGVRVEREEEMPPSAPEVGEVPFEAVISERAVDAATFGNVQLVVGCSEGLPENAEAPQSILSLDNRPRQACVNVTRHPESEISFTLSRTTENTGMAAARCLQLPSEMVDCGTQTHSGCDAHSGYSARSVQTEVSLPVQPGLKSRRRRHSRREAPPQVPRCMQTLEESPVAGTQEKASRRSRSASRSRDKSKEVSTRCLLLGTAKPIIPRFAETPENVISFCFLKALHFMNVRGVGCCNFHVGAEVLRRAANKMASERCNKHFAPFNAWQCANCFALNDDQGDEDDDDDPWMCGLCEQPKEAECQESGEDMAQVECEMAALDLY